MTDALRSFWQTEDGAVAVDWVVLTAAVVALSVATGAAFSDMTRHTADALSDRLSEASVPGALAQ